MIGSGINRSILLSRIFLCKFQGDVMTDYDHAQVHCIRDNNSLYKHHTHADLYMYIKVGLCERLCPSPSRASK